MWDDSEGRPRFGLGSEPADGSDGDPCGCDPCVCHQVGDDNRPMTVLLQVGDYARMRHCRAPHAQMAGQQAASSVFDMTGRQAKVLAVFEGHLQPLHGGEYTVNTPEDLKPPHSQFQWVGLN